MIKMKKIYQNLSKLFLVSLLLTNVLTSFATNYYVSNAGNDNNTGLSDKTPWKTLQKLSSKTFIAGDTIFLKCGDVWRETLTVSSSGNKSKRIVYTKYGTGVNPKVLASNQAISWTSQGNNVWKSDAGFTKDPYSINGVGSGNVWFINSDLSVITGKKWNSVSELKAEGDWYYGASSIYVYSLSNPATKYKSVEITTKSYGILLNKKEYIEINAINVYHANGGIYEGYGTLGLSGLIVRNCELAYSGYPDGNSSGILFCYNNSLIENNIIHNHGRRGISLININSSKTIKNVVIRKNTFHHGYHTTSVDLQLTKGYSGALDSVFIHDNFIYDEINRQSPAYPMQMFISDQGAPGKLTNIYVYNNVFKGATGASINIGGAEDVKVWNNTFYHLNTVSTGSNQFIFAGESTVNIKNNIFHAQTTSTKDAVFLFSNCKITSDYNCIYRPTTSSTIYKVVSTGDFKTSDSTKVRTTFGWDVHSVFRDPQVNSNMDYILTPTSPCIQRGISVGLAFSGKAPNIGARSGGSTLSNKAEFIAYSISNQVGNTTIDSQQKTIKLTLPYGTVLNNLIAKFSVSTGATVKVGTVGQVSGTTANNFSGTVTYRVLAQDGTTFNDWKITVVVAPNIRAVFTDFKLPGQKGTSVISYSTRIIDVTMPSGASLTNLIANYVISTGAKAFVNNVLQTNNLSSNNFTNPVIYKIVAQDGVTTTNWTINVKKEAQALTMATEQTINLESGWNTISFNVLPEETDLNDVLQPLIQSGNLEKVQDEEGNFMVNTEDGWYSNLKALDVKKGYNIKVTENAQLTVKGSPISTYNSTLNKGFNIIGYPLKESRPALSSFQDLINNGTLIKVQDETGKSIIKNGDTYINNMDSLRPGHGYYVVASQNSALDFSLLKSSNSFPTEEKATTQTFFKKTYAGNPYSSMNFIIRNLSNGNLNLSKGDEIGIFDRDSCVGTIVYNGEDILGVSAGMNDKTSSITGFTPGDSITFQIWRASEQVLYKNIKATFLDNSSIVFTAQGTASVELQTSLTSVPLENDNNKLKIKNYPNPFTDYTTFEFSLKNDERVTIEIYDITGKKVKTLTDNEYSAGEHYLTWDGTNDNGSTVNTGVYIYNFKAGYVVRSNKIIYAK